MDLILQSFDATHSAIADLGARCNGTPVEVTAHYQLPHQVWRIAMSDMHRSRVETIEFQQACDAFRVDYAVVPSQRSLTQYGLLAMDMDSTLITIECIDEIADMVNLKAEVEAITEAAMQGELDFNASLIQRVSLLKGLNASALQRVMDERLQFSPGAENLIRHIRQAGLKTLLVSGGFTFFTEQIGRILALDHTRANVLEVVDGVLTGNVIGAIVNAEQKRLTVAATCERYGLLPSQAIVAGDGANDLDMMSIAGFSLAFRAKPVVRQCATAGLSYVGLDGLIPLLSDGDTV